MSEDSVITDEMRAAIGLESEPITTEIEKGAILKFARAIGDDNPLYSDEVAARASRFGGIIAPPTFLRSVRAPRPPRDFRSQFSAGLDGGSEWIYFEPVRPGDRITVTARIADFSERKGRLGIMLFTIRETVYANQFGKTVAIQRSTGISYNPEAAKEG